MELLKTYINKEELRGAGFTLFEVLIVMGMLTILASMTTLFSMGFYKTTQREVERSQLISLLQTVRSEAMQNKDQTPHGLSIDPDGYVGYVLFSGESLATSDLASQIKIPRSNNLTFTPNKPDQVVFSQLSGDSDYQGEFKILELNSTASSSITINYEGAIY